MGGEVGWVSTFDPLRSFVAAFETSLLTIDEILRRRFIQAPTDMFVGSVQAHEEEQIAGIGSDQNDRSYDEMFIPPLHLEPRNARHLVRPANENYACQRSEIRSRWTRRLATRRLPTTLEIAI